MWIELDDDDCKDMIHQNLDTEGKPTGKVRILIPAFDLHSREVGDGNGKDEWQRLHTKLDVHLQKNTY